jgi:large subunit ribosomal protein L4
MATKVATKETKVKKAAPAAKTVEAKVAPTSATKKATGKFEVTTFNLSGKEVGSLALPEQIFGGKVSEALLAQALRVYNHNRQAHHGNTKTRGEVQGSTRKIFRQKGTGNARHGSIMAPIFVGGGIALGPRTRKTELDLPKKMKNAALAAALAQKHQLSQVLGLTGLEKASGKTKDMALFAKNLGKKSVLIVDREVNPLALRMVTNLEDVRILPVSQINVFEVIAHQSVAFTKDAADALVARFEKKEKEENNVK